MTQRFLAAFLFCLMLFSRAICVTILLAFLSGLSADRCMAQEKAKSLPETTGSTAASLGELKRQFNRSIRNFRTQYRSAKDNLERQEIVAARRAFERKQVAAAIPLARENSDPKATIGTLGFLWTNCRGQARDEIADFLLSQYRDAEQLKAWIQIIKQQDGPILDQERILGKLVDESTNKTIQGSAAWAMVGYLETIRRLHHYEAKGGSPFVDQPEQRERACMEKWTVDQTNTEIKVLMQRALNEWPLVEVTCTDFGDPTIMVSAYKNLLANAAAERLASLDRQVGMLAPEINGMDVKGGPMNLSQYRGKVVLLQFWSPWGPGSEMLKEQRRYAELLKNKPFAVVGVFQGEPTVGREYDFPFNSFDDASREITQGWNARMIEESYLIDAEGRIASKYAKGKQLRTQIEGLMKKLGHDVQLRQTKKPKEKSKDKG